MTTPTSSSEGITSGTRSSRPRAGMGPGSDSHLVTGLFHDRDSAERAFHAATVRGYDTNDINLVMSDQTRDRYFGDSNDTSGGTETELGNKAAEGAGVGGAIGGTVGAIAAAIAAVGTSIAVPGLGIVIAGPLAAGLAGAGAGAATGGVLGALIGWGMPEERVKHYESGIRQGGILMGLRARSEADARALGEDWKQQRGDEVYW